MRLEEHEVFSVVGEEGFHRLVAAFYRQVPGDDLLGPMYAGRDLEAAEQRLRDFLVFRFGGPPRYIADRGHPQLRMRHAPFPITKPSRDRWFQLMNTALEETIPASEAKQLLRAFFESTTTFLINRG